MKIILESKFEIGDIVDIFTGESFTVVDFEFKKNKNGEGKIFYLLEARNRERVWFSEDNLSKYKRNRGNNCQATKVE